MDKLTPEQRHRCMAAIKGKNTKPELLVRKFLFSHGFRYRLHSLGRICNPSTKICNPSSVHKEIEKICYRISNANIQRVQSVRIAKSKRSDCKSERTVNEQQIRTNSIRKILGTIKVILTECNLPHNLMSFMILSDIKYSVKRLSPFAGLAIIT